MATKYRLGTHIEVVGEVAASANTRCDSAGTSHPAPNEPQLIVVTPSELADLDIGDADAARTARALTQTRASFVEPYPTCFVGAIALPGIGSAVYPRAHLGFVLDTHRLTLIDMDEGCRTLSDELAAVELAPGATPARALYEVIRHLLKDDLSRLFELEAELAALEERIIDTDERHGVRASRILEHRRELMRLGNAYQQLDELSDDLAQDEFDVLEPADRRLFATLDRQAGRLSAKAQYLRDYGMQLIELTQVQADTRRDATSLYLTVIASVFVPITTITGWYGMNFSNMPELSWEYGYAVVIVLSLVIIAVELAFFKWKRWL